MPLTGYELVDDVTRLERVLDDLADLKLVGVDVERADWDRYYRTAALIQVGGEGRVALVDPMAVPELAVLNEFLAGADTVFHAGENDLQPLAAVGVVPPRIEDTAVAAAVLGLPTGLGTLLADLLDIELESDKASMQRADWEQRPMTNEMLRYAAEDVADLPALWGVLSEQLDAEGRRRWYEAELTRRLTEPAPEERRDWRRLKGIGRLDSATLARVHALWEAREELARTTDTAPGRIVADKVLVDLAKEPPRTTKELGRRGVRRQAARDFGEPLVQALMNAPKTMPESPATHGRTRRVTDDDRALLDRLRSLRTNRAEELGIEAGLLCPNRVLMPAVLSDPASEVELRGALDLRDWQWEQVGPAFVEAFELGSDGNAGGRTRRATSTEQGHAMKAEPLNADAFNVSLNKLDGWDGDTSGIHKSYEFADFVEAIGFVNRVAEVAEDMNHHPDLDIRWNTVHVTVVNHGAGAVTEPCIELATNIDRL